jgi:hypothetical protein
LEVDATIRTIKVKEFTTIFVCCDVTESQVAWLEVTDFSNILAVKQFKF